MNGLGNHLEKIRSKNRQKSKNQSPNAACEQNKPLARKYSLSPPVPVSV